MNNVLKSKVKWKNICIIELFIIIGLVLFICYKTFAYDHSSMNGPQFYEFIGGIAKCDTEPIGNGYYKVHTYTVPDMYVKGKKIDYEIIMDYKPKFPEEVKHSIMTTYNMMDKQIFNVVVYENKFLVNYR